MPFGIIHEIEHQKMMGAYRNYADVPHFYGGKMLRSIKNANDLIHEKDKNSAITVHTIRTWCKENKIKSFAVGNKILVDVQSLMDYINMKEN